MTVLLDSWAWIEYFRNGPKAKEVTAYIEAEEEIHASSITVAEVYRYLLSYETKQVAEKLAGMLIRRAILIPVTTVIAWKAAELKHEKKWGLGDSIIYATALLNKLSIVTGDSDFKHEEHVIYLGK